MSKRIPIILGLLLVMFAVWTQITSYPLVRHWFNILENHAYDLQLRATLLTKHKKSFTSSIVIVDIDDRSLREVERWPWSRSKLSELLNRIQAGGAAVVAFDILFTEKENNIAEQVLAESKKNNLIPPDVIDPILLKIAPFFDNDQKFAESLKKIDTVLAMSFIPETYQQGAITAPVLTLTSPAEKQLGFILFRGYIGTIPTLQQGTKSMGFINAFADEDGVLRRQALLIRYGDGLYPSLALEAVRLFLFANIQLMSASYGNEIRLEGIKMGSEIIPTDARGEVIIPYQGKSYTFPYIPAVDVLNNKVAADAFTGKIVFVGTSATGLSDLKPTSVQNLFPGIEIQATIADGLLKNNFSYIPGWALGAELLLTICFGILIAAIFPYLGPRILTLLIILLPTGFIISNGLLWEKLHIILSDLVPMLLTILIAMTNMVYGYFFETRKREQLKEMFGQYVPEEHIDEMLQSQGDYGLLGEDREMTVLFADIRNFTTISEKLTASQLKELLNDFFTPMTKIIFKHKGTIDKYVGDMIMAFWGAPLKDKKHAKNAIGAALEMQNKVKELQPLLKEKGWPEINIGVGLNSGTMSVGDMGSEFRRNYTVLGDAVNLGSRVESLTKHYGVHTIVTENTQKDQKHYVFKLLDKVRVKGKENGIKIYEAICRKAQLTPELKAELEKWDQALNYYFNQDWEKARAVLDELNKSYPHVHLYQLYQQRIAEFEQTPPPKDWDGVFTHHAK